MPDDRVRALADDYWETFLEANPLTATLLGDHRYDDRIEDLSVAGEEALRRRWAALMDRLGAIDTAGLDRADRATCTQLAVEIGDAMAAIDDRVVELQSDQMTGFHVGLLMVGPLVSAPDPQSAWKQVERLRQVPDAFQQAGRRFLAGAAAGRTPARVCVERSLNMIKGYLDSPLDADVLARMAGPSDWDEEPAWRAALDDVVREVVRPAYQRLADLLSEHLLPVARDDEHAGLHWLPDGDRLYRTAMRHHTSLDVTAGEIHQFGLDEVTRKLPEEYAEVGTRLFGLHQPAEVFARLREDTSLRYSTSEEMLAAARAVLESATAAMPRWFGRLPQAPCAISPVPEFLADDSPFAYYVPPAPDGSRGGTYFVNTAHPEERSRFDGAAVGFHEAIPGHHLQLSIASELTDLPKFRRFSLLNAAYGEGWGLYSERLADEMGLYPGDLDRIGMLSADSLRSCRLVVDTGLHALGWSRHHAIDFMTTHTPMSPGEVAVEVDRYLAMPGQALAYKVGQREIFRLRAAAESALGSAFDIRDFHDVVLGSGSVALPVLRQAVEDWMAGKR